MQDLPTVADELYGLDPSAFVAARTDRSRAAKDGGNPELAAQIARLRKPSTAAWAVNVLVRHRRADLQRLLALAQQMRGPAPDGQPADVRQLNLLAQRLVQVVTRLAGDLAAERGHALGPALTDQVRMTIRRAMADPVAAEAVLSGRLIATLEPGGSAALTAGSATGKGTATGRTPAGGVPTGAAPATAPDIAAALAVPLTVTSLAGRAASRLTGEGRHRERALAAARQAAAGAEQQAAEAADRARAAQQELDRLQQERDDLAAAADRIRRTLEEKEERLAGLQRRISDTSRTRRSIEEAARAAAARSDEAAARLGAMLESGDQ